MTTPAELRAQAAALEAQATQLETTQLTRADLAGMEPEAIAQARTGGQLDTLLGYAPTKESTNV
jgi:hypothetical protein